MSAAALVAGLPAAAATSAPPQAGATSAASSAATANGALLIDTDSGAYTIYPDGTRKKLVSTWLEDGQFSPDGKLIAWSGRRNGNTDIYVTTATGTNLRRVTTHPAAETSPTWSPDGKRLAFSSCRNQGLCDAYVLNSAAPYGQAKKITNSRFVGGGDAITYGPVVRWSPKADHLIVSENFAYESDHWDIMMAGFSSTGAHKPAPDGWAYRWDWAPDGRSLVTDNALQSDVDGPSNLRNCPQPFGACSDITPFEWDWDEQEDAPVYAPNGQLIAYHHGINDDELWFIRPDGTKARQFMTGATVMDWRAW